MYGRWDLQIEDTNGAYPSWAELTPEGGRFVGQWGSARPIMHVAIEGDTVEWRLPKQYENRDSEMVFRAKLDGSILRGTTTRGDGSEIPFVGSAAPELPAVDAPMWSTATSLLADGLDGWYARWDSMPSNWSISEDGLDNAKTGSDLVSRAKFEDFHLVAEYRYPTGSNSGIYLRGRYEFQILDDYGQAPSVGSSGAIYGFLTPTVNAIKAAGDWNRAEITLLGRHVTVVLNGTTIIDRAEIPGITGGALDSHEGTPGPIFVQGDHGPVTFRTLDIATRR